MKRHALLVAAGAALALVLGTGCSSSGSVRSATAPTCSNAKPESLLLVAQSVPSATQIPCIGNYPAGWSLGSVDVHNGQSSFSLHGEGSTGLKVVLEEDCDVAGANLVATDERFTLRYDRIPSGRGSTVVRNYRFEGGCVTYEFKLDGPAGTLMDDATLAIGFVSRSEIESRFYAVTKGGAK